MACAFSVTRKRGMPRATCTGNLRAQHHIGWPTMMTDDGPLVCWCCGSELLSSDNALCTVDDLHHMLALPADAMEQPTDAAADAVSIAAGIARGWLMVKQQRSSTPICKL